MGGYLHKVVLLSAMVYLLVVLVGGGEWTTLRVVESAGSFKHQEVMGSEKLVYNPELDRNYMMSKRRVPNGPDPIHNRRAGNSKRPPGQS